MTLSTDTLVRGARPAASRSRTCDPMASPEGDETLNDAPRATIYDVARAAQVATSTVSRAFTRPTRVNRETLLLIQATAAELGYRPNRTARGLSTGRTGSLAMVVPNIGNPFFTQFMRSFHAAARERDYSVYLIDTYENADEEMRQIDEVMSRVDGIALVSPRMRGRDLKTVTARGQFVVVHRRVPDLTCTWVDSKPALADALADLGRHGHQRLVYLSGPAAGYSDTLRRRAAGQIAGKMGIELTFTEPQKDAQEVADAANVALDLVATTGSTAVVAHNDASAIAVMKECRDRRIEVPRDLSIVGHDDIDWATVVYPALSTIAAQTEATGSWSATALIDLIEGPVGDEKPPPMRRAVEAQFIRRDTVALALNSRRAVRAPSNSVRA